VSSALIRQDLVPIGTGYLILMGVLALGLWLQRRSPVDGPEHSSKRQRSGAGDNEVSRDWPVPARSWLAFGKRVGGTALGGYLVLMAIVVLYYYGVAKVGSDFLESAVTGCALLLGLCLPLYAAASWLSVRRRRNRKEPRQDL